LCWAGKKSGDRKSPSDGRCSLLLKTLIIECQNHEPVPVPVPPPYDYGRRKALEQRSTLFMDFWWWLLTGSMRLSGMTKIESAASVHSHPTSFLSSLSQEHCTVQFLSVHGYFTDYGSAYHRCFCASRIKLAMISQIDRHSIATLAVRCTSDDYNLCAFPLAVTVLRALQRDRPASNSCCRPQRFDSGWNSSTSASAGSGSSPQE
jgi:hypothetical protein